MFLGVQYLADWTKIGEYRQQQTDNNTRWENSAHVEWDYQPFAKLLLCKDSILHKTETDIKVILGPSCWFLQMTQYGFNIEQHLKD